MTTPHSTVRTDGTHADAAPAGPAQAGLAQARAWKSWPDWVNVAFGVYLALAPLWTLAAPVGWFVTLGALIAVVGLWALGTASSSGAEWVQVVLGLITFLAPWIGGFATIAGAAWTAWIIGALVIIFAAVGMSQRKRTSTTSTTPAI